MSSSPPQARESCRPAIAADGGRMARTIEIVVPPGQRKERLDLFLTHHVENATRSKVQRAIREGCVLVDGRAVRSSHAVSGGELIHVTLPQPPPVEALPEAIPLEIVYEDEVLLVVNKPAGMVTHPAHGNYTGTLVNAVLHHCGGQVAAADPLRPGIVHRLDKDTSGLMVVAKTEHALAVLSRQFARRTVRREYQAIVWGTFREKRGRIDAALGRSSQDRKKMAVITGGKSAATDYELLEQFPWLALLRLKLHTGRTHQIRVHLAHINHPVFGDPVYHGRHMVAGPGTRRQKQEVESLLTLIPRQALHARTIGFAHPVSGKEMDFASLLPDDMQEVLTRLRSGGGD
jgi:23S rRNA pseudouridine1911/1915/1917 synthase